MHCTHFFPHDFVRSISPGILSRWALRPEHDRSPKYQSSQCCPNPWKKPTGFWKKRPEMTPMWDWRKSFILKKPPFGVFFGGSWMKGYLVEKMRIASESNLFCAASFFLQTRDTWKWRDRTPVFFRILKGTFQWKFHLQAKGVQTCQIEHL